MKVTHAGVLETLTTVGPLTSREVAEFFPSSSHENVAAVLSSLRTAARKRVYVHSWTRDNGHGKCVMRRVYAAGDAPDVRPPPRMPRNEITRRYRERNRLPKVANSVWNWRPGT